MFLWKENGVCHSLDQISILASALLRIKRKDYALISVTYIRYLSGLFSFPSPFLTLSSHTCLIFLFFFLKCTKPIPISGTLQLLVLLPGMFFTPNTQQLTPPLLLLFSLSNITVWLKSALTILFEIDICLFILL